jgi:hypothetical protein
MICFQVDASIPWGSVPQRGLFPEGALPAGKGLDFNFDNFRRRSLW